MIDSTHGPDVGLLTGAMYSVDQFIDLSLVLISGVSARLNIFTALNYGSINRPNLLA